MTRDEARAFVARLEAARLEHALAFRAHLRADDFGPVRKANERISAIMREAGMETPDLHAIAEMPYDPAAANVAAALADNGRTRMRDWGGMVEHRHRQGDGYVTTFSIDGVVRHSVSHKSLNPTFGQWIATAAAIAHEGEGEVQAARVARMIDAQRQTA